ncbi:uncharacterized protein LOC131677752 [Topomyia yanbarensis]|uniref:uncharacterized protein LOC131677752 n=1 Tax=Topomyia yanbarensis TaxID=2498891 RepID=UPI00273C4DED|nr:uncharacterized protein LOC131677752 [Topomyia yanbarensis]
MAVPPYRSRFNWQLVDGDLNRQISYNIQSSDSSEPIAQDDLLDPDTCLVLEVGEQECFCEQTICIHPAYQISDLALIAECATIESYVGRMHEYNQTHHGHLIFDGDAKLYRFDVSLQSCTVSELVLRYIVPPKNPLCIYGLHLNLAKNSNSLGLFSGKSTINQAMLKYQLDDTKLSEKAIKCKEFMLTAMGNNTRQQQPPETGQLQNIFNNNIVPPPVGSTVPNTPTPSEGNLSSHQHPNDPGGANNFIQPPLGSFSDMLKGYIDTKILELESALDAKLQAMELRQNQKLDNILSLLESISNKK